MLSGTTKTSAQVEIGRRHPYAVLFGLRLFGVAVAVAALAGLAFGVVFGVRWLLGHLPAPNMDVPNVSASGVPFGWIALALVASLAFVLIVRRLIRHIRYGV